MSAGVPERLPVELLVGVEPPVTDAGPVAVIPTPAFVEPQGPARPVVGGGSFNVAAALDGSGSYSDTMQRGEFLFYRVQLDWGQGLAYRVRFGETPGQGLAQPLARLDHGVRAVARGDHDRQQRPTRAPKLQVLPTNDPAITTAPVRYNNRTADVNAVRTQSVAGTYYIAVQIGPTADDPEAAVPVPIRLDVSVAGEPEPGPTYAAADARPGAPFGEETPAARAPSATDAATSTVIAPAGWAAIGAAGVLVLGLVGWLVVRRRRT